MELQDNQIRLSPAVDTTGRILVQYPDGKYDKVKEGLYIISDGKLFPSENKYICDIVIAELNNYGKDFSVFTDNYVEISNDYDPKTNCFELLVKYQDVTETFTAEYYSESEEYKYQLLTIDLKPAALCL